MAIKISTMNKPKSCTRCRLRETKGSYSHAIYKICEFYHADGHKVKYEHNIMKNFALKDLYKKVETNA